MPNQLLVLPVTSCPEQLILLHFMVVRTSASLLCSVAVAVTTVGHSTVPLTLVGMSPLGEKVQTGTFFPSQDLSTIAPTLITQSVSPPPSGQERGGAGKH